MNIISDSPLFSELLSHLRKGRANQLAPHFPSESYIALREEIHTDIVLPLFCEPALNVRFEAVSRRHRRDNAYCCVDYHRKLIKKAGARDLEPLLKDFRSDWDAALPGARFPFGWIIDRRDPAAKRQAEVDDHAARIQAEIQQHVAKASIWEVGQLAEESDAIDGWKRIHGKHLEWGHSLAEAKREIMRQYVLDVCKEKAPGLLWLMKWARGKPGRHPKEFNVLVYHIIKRCTRRKYDKNRNPRMRKDGQHRLETNWDLVVALLLDIHMNKHELPELARFIARNRRRRTSVAVRNLKGWLLNVRKNFPPIRGWAFQQGFDGVGLRKIIVSENGGLKGIHL